MEPLWTLPASSLPHPISILPLPTVRARLTAFPVLPPGTPCVPSPAVSTFSPAPGSGGPLPAPRSPLVTPPPQAPAFCVPPAGPFLGHVLSFRLETAALVTEATSPECSFPHRARETFAEGSRLLVPFPAKRPPAWTLPARREPNTIAGWLCRGDIQKPRQPYEISSWLLLRDSRTKNKVPGDPGRCHCYCY